MDNSSPSQSSAAPAVTQQPRAQHVMQQSFATEFSPDDENHGVYGSLMNCAGEIIGGMGSVPCCICCPNPYKSVSQGFVGLISRFGKFYKIVDPGLTKINPMTEKLIKVDIKIQLADIPQQVIMTKDNVNVHIDSVLYWHVVNPSQATFGVSDVQSALIERTQTTLRHILGMRVLQELIENREAIGEEIQEVIDEPARHWGVKVESVLIKDITFSKELQESLSSAAQAKRMAESKVIGAQAEVDSAKLMRAAADILNTPAAMQIRYLETMTSMAKGSNTRVIFMPTQQNGQDMTPLQANQWEQMAKQ
ncbi:MAG: stomatin-like protein [Linnemannia gamsii]|nr:MAG: stomatin-like protein [Linnemannia gamsii]